MSENPQAFPAAYTVGPNDDLYPPTPGMNLRDWFAGQALAGAFASLQGLNANDIPSAADEMKALAELVYMTADALLSERVKGGEK